SSDLGQPAVAGRHRAPLPRSRRRRRGTGPSSCAGGSRTGAARNAAAGGLGGKQIMRAVVTRVTRASVTVDGVVVGKIDEPGLLVLLGVTHSDGPEQAAKMARKLHEIRALRDEESCATTGAPLLVVSQFTLYG